MKTNSPFVPIEIPFVAIKDKIYKHGVYIAYNGGKRLTVSTMENQKITLINSIGAIPIKISCIHKRGTTGKKILCVNEL